MRSCTGRTSFRSGNLIFISGYNWRFMVLLNQLELYFITVLMTILVNLRGFISAVIIG